MKVQVEGSLYIVSDGTQFILREYTGAVDNKGNELYKVLGYYTNLEHLFDKVVKLKLMDSTAKTVKELLQDLKQIRNEVRSILKDGQAVG